MQEILKAAANHKGTALIHILQNCIIFNDGVFSKYTNKDTKQQENIFIEDGKPLMFNENSKGVSLVSGNSPALEAHDVKLDDQENVLNKGEFLVHDPKHKDATVAYLIGQMGIEDTHLPTAMGVIRAVEEPTYSEVLVAQEEAAMEKKGRGKLKDLIYTKDTWTVS